MRRFPTQDPVEGRLTALTALAGGAFTVAAGTFGDSTLAVVLGLIGVLIAVYEFIALATDRVPTITDTLTKNGLALRIVAIVIPVLAWIDHIGPGWVL